MGCCGKEEVRNFSQRGLFFLELILLEVIEVNSSKMHYKKCMQKQDLAIWLKNLLFVDFYDQYIQ